MPPRNAKADRRPEELGGAMPRVNGVLETCLYVENVEQAATFYEDLFGFRRMVSDEAFCALDVAGRSVLLLFRRGSTLTPTVIPGGLIPPHDGSGELHFALAISAEDLPAWEQRLARAGIALESHVHWERGGRSIYFRDPDNHLVELTTPGTWPIY
jgi:catechol 2,3-dioxygenase-like lactoylglutathione lyase family enzyme